MNRPQLFCPPMRPFVFVRDPLARKDFFLCSHPPHFYLQQGVIRPGICQGKGAEKEHRDFAKAL